MNSATDQTKRADEKMVALSTYLLSFPLANKKAFIQINTFFILTWWKYVLKKGHVDSLTKSQMNMLINYLFRQKCC